MPLVSIIVPCYNEEHTIRLLLEAIFQQNYPRQAMEVVIADGLSEDQTRAEITRFQQDHPDLKVTVLQNPKRIIPAGLNCAIGAASGDYIIRMDAHCIPLPDYVRRCVQALEENRGDNVGGVWEIQPGGKDRQHPSPAARGIAAAAAHPLGVGDAQYRFTNRAQEVDTVPFGAFSRLLVDRIGGFDETLLTNEDYEFNVRLRRSGGRVWLDPAIRSIYLARDSFPGLVRQYWRYGFWKGRMLRRNPGSLRWRQAVPPVFVLSLLALGGLSIWFTPARWLLLVEIFTYLAALFVVSLLQTLQRRDWGLLWSVPLAMAAMHFAWGSGFIGSLLLPAGSGRHQSFISTN